MLLRGKDKYFFSLNPSLYTEARHCIFVMAEHIVRLVFPTSFQTSGKKNQVMNIAKNRKSLKDRNVVLFPFKNMLLATLLSYKADPWEHNVVWKLMF